MFEIFLIVSIVCFVFLLSICFVGLMILRPSPCKSFCFPDDSIAYEKIEFLSSYKKKKKLRGWILNAHGSKAPVIIFMHGWSSSTAEIQHAAEGFVERGFNVVMVNALSHGNSDRVCYSGPQAFLKDLNDIINGFMNMESYHPSCVLLVGHSMGGVASLLTLAKRHFFSGAIIFSPFADSKQIMREYLKAYFCPYVPIGYLIIQCMRLWMKSTFHNISPIYCMKNISTETLLIHGETDNMIPPLHTYNLHGERSGNHIQLLIVTHCSHDSVVRLRSILSEVDGFLNEILSHAANKKI